MRIVYVCNEYPPHPHGGIGTFVRTIAHGMVTAGHEVTVLGYGPGGGQRVDKGVQVVTLSVHRTPRIAWLTNRLQLYCWLRREALAGRVDVVETPEFGGLLPLPFPYCSVVVRLHMSATAIHRQAGSKAAPTLACCEQHTLRFHRNWIAVSRFILDQTQDTFHVTPEHAAVIYNPVVIPDDEMVPPADLPTRFVLFVGTVSECKGAYVLAQACRRLMMDDHTLHLVYVGAPARDAGTPPNERIRRIVGTDLAARVSFLGRLEHTAVLACMRKATVFAFPSSLEAFSLVPLEAMACGTPVVYTIAASGPEAIEHGVTGLLANPYDSSDVAAKIAQVLTDPGLAERLTEAASGAVRQRFSLSRCLRDTIEFYTDTISHRDRGVRGATA